MIIIIGVYWTTEALPLGVTSLIPIALFPLLGILSTGEICPNYMTESVMMAMGGMIMALSVERSNLHKRIALRVVILVGANPRRYLRMHQLTAPLMKSPLQGYCWELW